MGIRDILAQAIKYVGMLLDLLMKIKDVLFSKISGMFR